jgi:hypothetical protein
VRLMAHFNLHSDNMKMQTSQPVCLKTSSKPPGPPGRETFVPVGGESPSDPQLRVWRGTRCHGPTGGPLLAELVLVCQVCSSVAMSVMVADG